MTRICKWLSAVFFFALLLLCHPMSGQASDADDTVSVTIPTHISIVFQEDGTNSVSEFAIKNESELPVELATVGVTECGDWELVEEETVILSNTKQIAVKLEDGFLESGENQLNIAIPENSTKTLNLEVKRGAWTEAREAETAFTIEFVYSFGAREFELNFDANGGENSVPSIKVYNGESVELPKTERRGYAFEGWKDEEGNLYKENYVMPVGDTLLTASWIKTQAYALYCAADHSLTFTRAINPIQVGDTYEGKTVTYVYTGFETSTYSLYYHVPWLNKEDAIRGEIYKVVMDDWIQPVSTSYWFFCMNNCKYWDVSKLDTSRVTQMISMFSSAGCDVTDSVTIKGLSGWNTAQVVSFGTMFRAVGTNAKTFVIDDIGAWDTSNATDMYYMFVDAGKNAEWSMDLSNWNVKKVAEHEGFHKNAEDKITPPNW